MGKQKLTASSYIRVSTPGQAKDGLSLDEQSESIKAFIEQQGWSLVEEYRDAGKSGEKDFRKRPEFVRMLSDALAGQFEILVCLDIQRFSRNPKDYFWTADELDKGGVAIVTLEEPNFDKLDDAQVLGRDIKVVIGRYQARQSRAKSIRVRQAKLERGEYRLGQRIPYGLRWTDRVGHALEHDPEAIKVWRLMKHLRKGGYGYGRIVDILNGRHELDPKLAKRFKVTTPVPNRYGKKLWHESTVASLFADENRITGKLQINFKTLSDAVKVYTVDFPPLMTRTEFEMFRKLARKNLSWQPRNVGKGSMLSGLCRCGECGARIGVSSPF